MGQFCSPGLRYLHRCSEHWIRPKGVVAVVVASGMCLPFTRHSALECRSLKATPAWRHCLLDSSHAQYESTQFQVLDPLVQVQIVQSPAETQGKGDRGLQRWTLAATSSAARHF